MEPIKHTSAQERVKARVLRHLGRPQSTRLRTSTGFVPTNSRNSLQEPGLAPPYALETLYSHLAVVRSAVPPAL